MSVTIKTRRVKRTKKLRNKLCALKAVRLVVHRTSRHIYAQIISNDNLYVLASASTTERDIISQLSTKITSNKKAAALVGKVIADRAIKKGIIDISFDRSGFKYHGRVKELADSARQSGLRF